MLHVGVLMFIFVLSASAEQCDDPNAYWSECAPNCPERCSAREVSCIQQACQPGCVCKRGYALTSSGYCVKRSECLKCRRLGPLYEYSTCGSYCPSCQLHDYFCPLVCRTGCFCERDLLPNSLGQCIPREKCESCSANEEFREDVGGCPQTCERPEFQYCPTFVRQDECTCVNGYVRHRNGTCVTLEECPKNPGGCGK